MEVKYYPYPANADFVVWVEVGGIRYINSNVIHDAMGREVGIFRYTDTGEIVKDRDVIVGDGV